MKHYHQHVSYFANLDSSFLGSSAINFYEGPPQDNISAHRFCQMLQRPQAVLRNIIPRCSVVTKGTNCGDFKVGAK